MKDDQLTADGDVRCYVVLSTPDLDYLEREVGRRLENGWKLYGDLKVIASSLGNGAAFYQVVVR